MIATHTESFAYAGAADDTSGHTTAAIDAREVYARLENVIPTTVITGFLGSGKTTLLNRILRHVEFRDSLVIINEFGEIGIDHLIVAAPTANTRLLASGCLCCEMRGELVEALGQCLRMRHDGRLPPFRHVFIETSGLADPVPIVHALVSEPALVGGYRLHSIVTVVDALHGASQLQVHDEARKQVALADIILVSKTDLAIPSYAQELQSIIATMNPLGSILPAGKAATEANTLLRGNPRARAAMIGFAETKHEARREAISTFSYTLDRHLNAAGLSTWLSMLASFKAQHLLRVKGIVNVAGEPFVIDLVQSVIHEPVPLARWPTSDERTRLVFIVQGLLREDLDRTFCAFDVGAIVSNACGFDRAGYARFARAARRFL